MVQPEEMTAIEYPDLVPQCPHCDADLTEFHVRRLVPGGKSASSFRFGRRYVYACPSCNKAIGVSHRKGFWAG
jgi:hypothetical protein